MAYNPFAKGGKYYSITKNIDEYHAKQKTEPAQQSEQVKIKEKSDPVGSLISKLQALPQTNTPSPFEVSKKTLTPTKTTNTPAISTTLKPTPFLSANDQFAQDHPILNKVLPIVTKVGNYSLNSGKSNPISAVTNTVAGAFGGLEKALGINYARRLVMPEIEKSVEQVRKDNPTAAAIGQFAGTILPGMAASKIAGKMIGNTLLKGGLKDAIAQETLAGALYGGVDGAIDSATSGGNASDIGNEALNRGVGYGMVGGGLTGALGIAGKSLMKTGLPQKVGNYLKAKELNNLINQTELPNKYIKFGEKPIIPENIPQQTNKIKLSQAEYNKLPIQANKVVLNPLNNTKGKSILPNENMGVNEPINQPDFLNTFANGKQNEFAYKVDAEGNPIVPKIVNSEQADKKSIGQRFSDIYKNWVDSNNTTNDFSKATNNGTYLKATNTKKVGGTISYILNDGLVDTQGKNIGSGFKEVVNSIPKNKENDFLEYMLLKHNADRFSEGKPVYSMYDPKKSMEMANELLRNNPEFKNSEKGMRNFIDNFNNEWLVNTGLVSKDTMENLRNKYPGYLPTQRMFNDVESSGVNGAKSGVVNQGNTLKSATGSNKDIKNPIETIMTMVNKTVRTAKRNEVGQAIVKAVREQPEKLSKYAEILPTTKAEMESMQQALKGNDISELTDETGKFIHPAFMSPKPNIVTVLEDGKPVYLQINDKDFLDEITGLSNNVVNIPKSLSIFNNLFKGLITQKNPFFAIRNIARDIPTAYINGSEANPLKFAYNLAKAGKNIIKKDDIYKQYKALGGGEAQFFNAQDVTSYKKGMETSTKNPLKLLGKGIEKFNSLTETAPRLAEFEKTLKSTGDTQKALYNSGEITTNFSRGGKSAKNVDAFVPYFNAGVQGLDKLARQLKNNPVKTLTKGAVGITTPTMALHLINKDDPYYQQLDDRTKDNNYLIPIGDGKFLKFPKARELGVLFGSLFERIASGNFENFGSTVATNFSPSNPITNNIAAPIYNLKSNKDFAGRTIVPQNLQDLSPRYQYDEKTSEIAKQIGNIANLSPKQIDYLIKSYTGALADIIQPATTKGGNIIEKLIVRPFTADVAYNNKTTDVFYKNLDKLKTIAKDKNVVEGIPSKDLTDEEEVANAFNSVATNLSKLKKNIQLMPDKDLQRKEQMKLNNKLNDMNNALKASDLGKIKDIRKDFDKLKKSVEKG